VLNRKLVLSTIFLFTVRIFTSFIAATFQKDAYSNTFERAVFSILDLTGMLGGLFEVLERCGAMFVGFFADKIFLFSVISKLYQVDRSPKGNFKFQILIDPESDNKVGPSDHNSRQKKITEDQGISFKLNLIVSHFPEVEARRDNEVI
jgi:hypothetical protein